MRNTPALNHTAPQGPFQGGASAAASPSSGPLSHARGHERSKQASPPLHVPQQRSTRRRVRIESRVIRGGCGPEGSWGSSQGARMRTHVVRTLATHAQRPAAVIKQQQQQPLRGSTRSPSKQARGLKSELQPPQPTATAASQPASQVTRACSCGIY